MVKYKKINITMVFAIILGVIIGSYSINYAISNNIFDKRTYKINKKSQLMPVEINGIITEENFNPAKVYQAIEEIDSLDTTRANNTEAFYLDYEESLEAVKNNADLIVVGKVIEQSEYGEIGIKNTIMVTNTIKGKAVDEIYVLKSGSLSDEAYILKEGKKYVLLLGDQSKSGENTYFIKGGEQGCFLIDDGVLSAKDAVMDKELKNMIENENESMKSGTDQVKTMLDYLRWYNR